MESGDNIFLSIPNNDITNSQCIGGSLSPMQYIFESTFNNSIDKFKFGSYKYYDFVENSYAHLYLLIRLGDQIVCGISEN